MLFDAQAALADILKSQPPIATPATFATNSPVPAPVSPLSRLSQPVAPANASIGSFGTVAQPFLVRTLDCNGHHSGSKLPLWGQFEGPWQRPESAPALIFRA